MASTSLITNIKTVQSNGPSSATQANANAAAGQIVDYPGEMGTVLLNLEEANVKLTALLAQTDQSSDGPNYTLISNVLASLS